jgi:iron complex transport system substrate-binding protein
MTVPARRIVSFLPSATEMVYALGLEERLLGVTHECDWPPAATKKPIVVRAVLPIETMSQREIDDAVSARMRNGESLYRVDEELMRELAPELILTQDLCQVCAPSGNEVTQLLATLPAKPEILYLTPRTVEEIFGNIAALAEATGVQPKGKALISEGRARLDRIAKKTRDLARPRVFCLEWLDPVYCCGHWVPEMVRIAGGIDSVSCEGTDSVRVSWQEVLDFAPEVLIVMPCGFHLGDAARQADMLFAREGWQNIPAVRSGRVYAVDASSYFARPGPRVVEGTELLAHLIHPELIAWNGPADAFCAIGTKASSIAAQ